MFEFMKLAMELQCSSQKTDHDAAKPLFLDYYRRIMPLCALLIDHDFYTFLRGMDQRPLAYHSLLDHICACEMSVRLYLCL